MKVGTMKWDGSTGGSKSQSTLQVLFIAVSDIYIRQNIRKLGKSL